MTRTTIAEMLEAARSRLERLGRRGRGGREDGALLLDVRSELQRERDGTIPGALFHPRNAVEWRADPSSGTTTPR